MSAFSVLPAYAGSWHVETLSDIPYNQWEVEGAKRYQGSTETSAEGFTYNWYPHYDRPDSQPTEMYPPYKGVFPFYDYRLDNGREGMLYHIYVGAEPEGGKGLASASGTVNMVLRYDPDQDYSNNNQIDPNDKPKQPIYIKVRLSPSVAAGDGEGFRDHNYSKMHVEFSAQPQGDVVADSYAISEKTAYGRKSIDGDRTFYLKYDPKGQGETDAQGSIRYLVPLVDITKAEAKLDGDRKTYHSWNDPDYRYEWNLGRVEVDIAVEAEHANIVFVLSTTPSASSGPGDIGSTGLRQITTLVAPEDRSYYVIVTGVFRIPSNFVPPSQVAVTANRVRYVNGHATPTGESVEIPLVMVTQSQSGAPVVNSDGTTTYTYRTHDLTDDEESPQRKAGTQDWHIDDKLGRWQFTVKDYPSNTVEFKVDKRGQVTGYALDWAGYYKYRQQHAQSEAELDQWSTTMHPNGLFTNCFTFAGHIYNRHGLLIAGSDGTGMFGAATAPDSGPGSLRFFWTDMPNPTGAGDPGHVGVIGPYPYFGYGTRIDNNGMPTDSKGFNGPLWRGLDDGVGDTYFGGAPRPPKSQTLPGQVNSSISLLEELDAE